MAVSVTVSANNVVVTDKDGNSAELIKDTTDKKDVKAGKVKITKKTKETGKEEKREAPALIPVVYVDPKDNGGKTSWSFSNGDYAVIDVFCPTAKEENEKPPKKPTIHVSVNNPHVEATVELKDHKAQDAEIEKLKKMFGGPKK